VRTWAVAVAVALGSLVAAGVGADSWEDPGEIDTRTRVAILPMVVNSMDDQAYLRSGLADMLATRLGRNAELAVVRVDDDASATTDPVKAAQAGLELGARYVVFGSFTQFGEGASLDVQCVEARAYDQDKNPSARRIFIQSGTVGEIIPQLDSTAQKISLFTTGQGPGARKAELAPAAEMPPVAAGPAAGGAAAGAPAEGVGTSGDVDALRRRVEALEEYLFGGPQDRLAGSEADEGSTAQEFRLR